LCWDGKGRSHWRPIGVANVVVTNRMELWRGEIAISKMAVAVIEVWKRRLRFNRGCWMVV